MSLHFNLLVGPLPSRGCLGPLEHRPDSDCLNPNLSRSPSSRPWRGNRREESPSLHPH